MLNLKYDNIANNDIKSKRGGLGMHRSVVGEKQLVLDQHGEQDREKKTRKVD